MNAPKLELRLELNHEIPDAAADDYRPSKFHLSNSEVRATGILGQGAVHNIARELLELRAVNAKLRAENKRLVEKVEKWAGIL